MKLNFFNFSDFSIEDGNKSFFIKTIIYNSNVFNNNNNI